MKKWMPLLCLVLCLLLPLSAWAERVEPDHAASLTLWVTHGGVGLPGASFEVFRVAEMDRDARFVMLSGYQAGSADINKVDGAAAWASLAERLAKQAGTPTAKAVTDQQGKALFADLQSGLYLVKGQPLEKGDYVYEYAPFMVSVPGKAEGKWQYDVTADVKVEPRPLLFDMPVIKYWKDPGYVDKRPDEITVDLYCDGAVLQSVKLNARNHWKHTFEDLERTHTWMVKEQKVPSGYKVTYDTSNGAQIITNTYVKQVPGQQTIPQTGLMWWPVPVMAVLGLTLVIIGLAMRRKWSNEP